MKAHALRGAGILLLILALPASGWGYELERGLNNAGVIDFPTALDQPVTNALSTTIEITDIAKPVINLYDVRYGFQYGIFNLLTDVHYLIEPRHEANYAEVKAKLRVLSMDEFRTYLAFGLLGRWVEKAEEKLARIDDRPASLFGIASIELFPIDQWGGMLFNFYLDNRYFNLGLKTQLYPSVQAVGELDYLHSTLREDKYHGRAGIELDGGENFYVQFLYTDLGKRWLVQLGTGF